MCIVFAVYFPNKMTSSVEYFCKLCEISLQLKRFVQEHDVGKIHWQLLFALSNGLDKDEFSTLWQCLKNKTQWRKKQLKKVAQLINSTIAPSSDLKWSSIGPSIIIYN
jgi:hypothetical protein